MALRVLTSKERCQGDFSLIAERKVLIHVNTSRGCADKLPSEGSPPSTAGRVFPEDGTLRQAAGDRLQTLQADKASETDLEMGSPEPRQEPSLVRDIFAILVATSIKDDIIHAFSLSKTFSI